MIIKSYEISKIDQNITQLILFYGKNEGLKNEEKEILDDESKFIENILSKSLFEKKKFITIKRSTDKLLKKIEILNTKNLEDTCIVISSDNLEKKSKLRSFFEKNKKLVCVPFYPDNEQTLYQLAY